MDLTISSFQLSWNNINKLRRWNNKIKISLLSSSDGPVIGACVKPLHEKLTQSNNNEIIIRYVSANIGQMQWKLQYE